VLALGMANLVANGLSMGVGNYLGIKSERATELGGDFSEWAETLHAAKHGLVTWGAFIVAGLAPLLPFLFGMRSEAAFRASIATSLVTQFTVGALRTVLTKRSAWRSGLEMLLVGALAGGSAFVTGRFIERWFR
jgi:VIT1/CCC1 family predicted Fe2+/Mn2+ transporter